MINPSRLSILLHSSIKCLISPSELSEIDVTRLSNEELATDQIERVSTKAITHFPKPNGPRIVLIDYGYKKNILSSLLSRGCDIVLVPFNTTAETIKDFKPDGIVLSNGPGDPESIASVIPTVRELQNNYPIFGICMGHEIFAMANGAGIRKMKFGHRGGNHPVKDLNRDRVYITSQNHGYCVDEHTIDGTDLEITQINLNDKTIEGLRHKTLNAMSVQYHPEASPGPMDTMFLFDEFLKNLKGGTHAS